MVRTRQCRSKRHDDRLDLGALLSCDGWRVRLADDVDEARAGWPNGSASRSM